MAQKKFVCSVCGYVHVGDKAPDVCPQCKQPGSAFKEEKKGLDTNSNVYTIVYAMVIVVIVAVLLALVSQLLSPRQQANALLDQQKQILVALNQDYSNADPAQMYRTLVNDTIYVGENKLPVYLTTINGETKYVFELKGTGLWGGIGGYLALDADKNTIFGINFNHESETPGLGADIVTAKFRNQFNGKHIRNAQGELSSVAVLKTGKTAENGAEQVDALSGATITCTGVSDMLYNRLHEYEAFLNDGTASAATASGKATAKPVTLVDGVVFMDDINSIDVNDIAAMDVIKDMDAIRQITALSGYSDEELQNGVIAIITRKEK